MPASRSNVTKRACDGCKIRKIRCGGGQPCQACTNSRIRCTYIRVQQPRGPQRLRSTTKYLIEQTQRGLDAQNDECISVPVEQTGRLGHQTERLRIPTDILAPPLYVYHMRMYPVWPIVNVESLISVLQEDTERRDLSTYSLATAVAAATLAQLKLEHLTTGDSPTADAFAAESLHARDSRGYRSKPSLDNIRTSFFLHVYYENQQSGGSESLLYLREAITMAQMMRLHQEASYIGLSPEEQQLRRRILWLLFVTERGVCILHQLPVILRTNISTPGLDVNDEPQVLPAFLKLLNLFRLFESSKMFDVIECESVGTHDLSAAGPDGKFLRLLQDGLQDGSALLDHTSDVQKADLCVTRHWMRLILWKNLSRNTTISGHSPTSLFSPLFPVMVAKELMAIVTQLPRPAIEAHGLGMELKLYEIANSLADAVMDLAMLPRPPVWDVESRPSQILARLHAILSTFRGGGNKQLVALLYKKMAEVQSISGLTLGASLKAPAGRPQLQQSSESSTCSNAITENAFLDQSTSESSQMMTMTDWFNFGPSYILKEGGDAQPDRSDGNFLPDDTITAIASTSANSSDAWTAESLVITEDIGEMASLFTSLPLWTTSEEEFLEECSRNGTLTSFESSLPNEDMTFWHAPIVGT
ncbi:probable sucrose utilization protein SUC1 [Aspergillus udagawae]|uniref:Probable sucrose utilization protein SUC1 n=1 Tax=Aspergillus udagawae TaxID=91492 RepID=A0ABQ1AC67_9EURO|nr:probable sucrose utilization protein SUC1 [Aspergillus udagawae]